MDPDEIPGLLASTEEYDPSLDTGPLPGDPSQSMSPDAILGPDIPESMVLPGRYGPPPSPVEQGHWVYDEKTGRSVPVGDPRAQAVVAPQDQNGPPPAALGAQGAYQIPDPSIPETLNIRGMFGPPPGINLREAEKTLRDLEGYEKGIAQSEQASGGLLAERTSLVQQQSMAEQALVKEQADIKRKAIDAQREADNLRLKAMEEAKADVRSKISGLQDLQGKLAEAKIDPGRFWAERTTGQKVAIAIGIALSSFGSILSGGKQPNYALDIIDKAIDRDLDAQKADIDRLGMRVNIQQNLIAQTRAIAQDDQAAYAAAKAMALDRVSEQLDLATLRYKDETTKSRLALLGNDIAAKAQDFRMKTLDHLSGAASRRFGAQFQIAQAKHEAARGTWAIQMQLASKMGERRGTMPGQSPELQWLSGSEGPAKKEAAARASKDWESGKALDQSLDALIKLGEAKSGGNPMEFRRLQKKALAAASQIQLYVQEANDLGVPSLFDYKMITNIAPNPRDWSLDTFTGISVDVLKQTRRMMRQKVLSNVRGANLEPKPGFNFPEMSPEEEEGD